MSTCLADSSSDGCYTSIAMSKSSSSSSNASISTSPTESSATEGLEHVNIHLYAGISNMQKLINSQSERLQKGDSNQQYLIFTRVRAADLAKIDDVRSSLGKSTRMTYYTDTDQLIIKLMPSAKHEKAHLNLGKKFVAKLIRMGMPEDLFDSVGAQRFEGPTSSKEADTAYKPLPARRRDEDWPTIVFESGLSESLRRLRVDARWWLENSGGDVKIVVLISLNIARATRTLQSIRIEKWELAPAQRRITRSVANNPPAEVPTKVQEITINPNTVTGAPLILHFQKIFLRQPTPPEADIVFSAQDLSDFSASLW